MAAMIARTVNYSAKRFCARKYLPSGGEVWTRTVCRCGVGFVVGLRVLEDNELSEGFSAGTVMRKVGFSGSSV